MQEGLQHKTWSEGAHWTGMRLEVPRARLQVEASQKGKP